jgi:hypothetical protein
MFVWKGDDFVISVGFSHDLAARVEAVPDKVSNVSPLCWQLVRSLDFLGSYKELVEWYGEEFPLDGNPFMRSSSLLDKAAERGPRLESLRPSSASNSLRDAVRKKLQCSHDGNGFNVVSSALRPAS